MKTIDCLGDMCPIPLIKLNECKELFEKSQIIKLVTDHSCTVEAVSDFCEKKQLSLTIEEPMNGIWELFISQ